MWQHREKDATYDAGCGDVERDGPIGIEISYVKLLDKQGFGGRAISY